MGGLYSFIARRSITAIVVLVVVAALTAGILYAGACARIDAIITEIRQQVMQEIIDNDMRFSSQEEMDRYIDMRIKAELAKKGLDICV